MLLEGVKVIEMSTWVAGPSAGAVMADWGAEVVKVEAPGGDAMPGPGPGYAGQPGKPDLH